MLGSVCAKLLQLYHHISFDSLAAVNRLFSGPAGIAVSEERHQQLQVVPADSAMPRMGHPACGSR